VSGPDSSLAKPLGGGFLIAGETENVLDFPNPEYFV